MPYYDLETEMEKAYRRAQTFRQNFKIYHPYIYAACKFVVMEGLSYGIDALGGLFGDPLLFEEIKLIYFGVKFTHQISCELYHYLKSIRHLHGQDLEYIHEHEGAGSTLKDAAVDQGQYISGNWAENEIESNLPSCQCTVS